MTKKEQTLTLRPYLNIEATPYNYIDGGTPEEKWKIYSIISNTGKLPTIDAQVYTWTDYHDSLVVDKMPYNLNKYSISPHSGTITTNFTITKKSLVFRS